MLTFRRRHRSLLPVGLSFLGEKILEVVQLALENVVFCPECGILEFELIVLRLDLFHLVDLVFLLLTFLLSRPDCSLSVLDLSELLG